MGSWGFGTRHDDFVCDVIGDFEDVLKAGKSVAEATAAVVSRHRGARPPRFGAGQCLSTHRFNGNYGAAIVLAADHSTLEQVRNLVGLLDYSSHTGPTLEVFVDRRWRRIAGILLLAVAIVNVAGAALYDRPRVGSRRLL